LQIFGSDFFKIYVAVLAVVRYPVAHPHSIKMLHVVLASLLTAGYPLYRMLHFFIQSLEEVRLFFTDSLSFDKISHTKLPIEE